MTKAKNLLPSDEMSLLLPAATVLEVTPLAKGYYRIKIGIEDAPSLQFADGGCVLDIIAKGGRNFSSFPWRGDQLGGGGADGPYCQTPMMAWGSTSRLSLKENRYDRQRKLGECGSDLRRCRWGPLRLADVIGWR